MIDIDPDTSLTGQMLQDELMTHGVKLYAVGEQRVRCVTHLDINDEDIETAVAAFSKIFS